MSHLKLAFIATVLIGSGCSSDFTAAGSGSTASSGAADSGSIAAADAASHVTATNSRSESTTAS